MGHNGKYYLIYLQDASNKPYQIKRNYEYKIIIDKLDESRGYSNLQEALKSAPVNNPWITIQQIVPGVSNGDDELKIEGGTYKFVHSGEGTKQEISFTYKGNDAASKQASAFKAIWTEIWHTQRMPSLWLQAIHTIVKPKRVLVPSHTTWESLMITGEKEPSTSMIRKAWIEHQYTSLQHQRGAVSGKRSCQHRNKCKCRGRV